MEVIFLFMPNFIKMFLVLWNSCLAGLLANSFKPSAWEAEAEAGWSLSVLGQTDLQRRGFRIAKVGTRRNLKNKQTANKFLLEDRRMNWQSNEKKKHSKDESQKTQVWPGKPQVKQAHYGSADPFYSLWRHCLIHCLGQEVDLGNLVSHLLGWTVWGTHLAPS